MRHGPEEKCAVAKWLSLEAGRGQHLRVLAERGGVRRGQLDRLGDEQGVARDATARALGAQPLEGDALVRRVLVDEHHPTVSLAHEVAVEDLADEAERRKPARRRAPERQRRTRCESLQREAPAVQRPIVRRRRANG